MNENLNLAQDYPGEITIDGMTLVQSADELLLVFKPDIKTYEIDLFLRKNDTLIQSGFKAEDEKSLLLKTFNRKTLDSKWVLRANGNKETLDKLIGTLETDGLIQSVTPVYHRKGLKHPNGFTYKDEIVVRHGEKTDMEKLCKLYTELGAKDFQGPLGELGKGFKRLRVSDGNTRKTYEIARKLDESSLTISARVNIYQLHGIVSAIPNDTWFNSQWNLKNTGQGMPDGGSGTVGCDIDVEQAWDISKGSPLIVVAVLDTGCDTGHDDLTTQLVQPDRWYNAQTGTSIPTDDLGHGTLVAGIISAATNIYTPHGTAGVSWYSRIMPIRVWWNSGQTSSEATILNALNFARTNGAHIINMSWEWEYAQANIDISLQACIDDGIVLCAASGNYAGLNPNIIAYPAINANVIAVGATNEDDRRCTISDWPWGTGSGSQYGPELSVVAPGVHTWSTDIRSLGQGYNSMYGGGDVAGDYFNDFGGTSGATAHVSGLAALILGYNPTLTPAQVRTIIESNAEDQVGIPAEDTPGRDNYMGFGRINAHNSLLDVQNNYPYGPSSVYIRNSLTDGGAEPYIGGTLCYSPDIIVRQAQVADPQTTFADMTVDPGSDPVEIGNDNYVYVRVHNNGGIATDTHVRVYYAPLNTTCGPEVWNYLGQIDFYAVAAGGDAVSNALVWENAPDPDPVSHYCLIASIEGVGDPHPNPAGISNASQYMQFIRDHNNICYRNLTFVNNAADTLNKINFFIGGFIRDESEYQLKIEREDLAIFSETYLHLPLELLKYSRVVLENLEDLGTKGDESYRTFLLSEGKSAVLNRLVIPGPKFLAQLEINIPKDAKPGDKYAFNVKQLYKDEVIGDFRIAGKVIDAVEANYIGLKDQFLVHKAGCKCVSESANVLKVPFQSIEEAKKAGYDMALDCLNQPFTAADVSHRLARKVLYFVNRVRLPKDLSQKVEDTLGIGYSEGHYGKQEKGRKGYGLGIRTANKILDARELQGPFTSLKELEDIKGFGKDTFIDLVNSFKKT